MLKNASKQIKSAIYQANKVICNQENFHLVVPTTHPNDEDSPPMKIELCRNT